MLETMEKQSHNEVVCVLGMHRSGTSVAARLLNILGVYLGPEDHLMSPGIDNPKGFWEHQLLTSLNEEILGLFGGYHLEPPKLPRGWENFPILNDLKLRACRILDEDFGAAPLWGWKDPRNSLTLSFWQQLLPRMRYVICLRNPIDIAYSIERRNGVCFDRSVRLWLKHTSAALLGTAGKNRIIVFYEDFMAGSDKELYRLSKFLGKSELIREPRIHSAVHNFLDKQLQHHQTRIQDLLADCRIGFPEKALFMTLRLYVDLQRANVEIERGQDAAIQEALDILAGQALDAEMRSFESVKTVEQPG